MQKGGKGCFAQGFSPILGSLAIPGGALAIPGGALAIPGGALAIPGGALANPGGDRMNLRPRPASRCGPQVSPGGDSGPPGAFQES